MLKLSGFGIKRTRVGVRRHINFLIMVLTVNKNNNSNNSYGMTWFFHDIVHSESSLDFLSKKMTQQFNFNVYKRFANQTI